MWNIVQGKPRSHPPDCDLELATWYPFFSLPGSRLNPPSLASRGLALWLQLGLHMRIPKPLAQFKVTLGPLLLRLHPGCVWQGSSVCTS